MEITEEKKSLFRRFRKWTIVQKYTLQRGYAWGQVPAIGVIFASSIKAAFPGFIDSINKFAILVLLSFLGLWCVGYLDKRLRFLHEENIYCTETNPMLMAGLRGELGRTEKKNKTDKMEAEDEVDYY